MLYSAASNGLSPPIGNGRNHALSTPSDLQAELLEK